MGIYTRWLLPRLIDLAMRSRMVRAERARLLPLASGRVLEVGIGSGLNLPFYGPSVRMLLGLDPSLELWRLGARRRRRPSFPVHFLQGSAEAIPAASASVDTVVSTWMLCSVADPAAALAEMKRVLGPAGQLLFIEHGRSPDPSVLGWQNRLNPLWRRLGGGCNLNRDIGDLIAAAGFFIARVETGYIAGPRLATYLYRGIACVEPSDGRPEGPDFRRLPPEA